MKKLRSILCLILGICLVLAVFCGCSGNTSTTIPTDAGTTAPAPDTQTPDAAVPDNSNHADSQYPTAENPLTLTINIPFAETIDLGAGYAAAAEYINENSGGALVAKVYYDETLLSFNDGFRGCATGTADITWLGPANIDGNLNLNRVFSMIYEYVPGDMFKLLDCDRQIFEAVPELNKELADYNLTYVSLQACSPCVIATNKTSIITPDDIKGKSINCIGASLDFLSSLSASTVTLSAGDYYLSLERGVIDGMYDGPCTFYTFGMTDLIRNVLVFGEKDESDPTVINGISASPNFTVANLDTWNKLSPEQQQLVKDAFDYGIEIVSMKNYYHESTAIAMQTFEENGATITYLTGDELAVWLEGYEDIVAAWVETTTAKGYDAQTAYDTVAAIYAGAK